jgi:hypothetical protein
MTGSLPDANLSLDLSDLVGRLRRQANVSSRFGQYEALTHLADELVTWQRRIRRALALALGEDDDATATWTTLVNQVSQVRHERDSAQMLHNMATADLREYDRQQTAQSAELDALRRTKTSE